jgi:peptide/nickel transport system substrate-binding protein
MMLQSVARIERRRPKLIRRRDEVRLQPASRLHNATMNVSQPRWALGKPPKRGLGSAGRALISTGLMLGLALTLVATSCEAQTPQNGGTIVTTPGVGLGTSASVNGLNPLLTSSAYDAAVESLMYQPLLWVDRTLHIDFKRSIASAITVSDNNTVFTVELHRHWHWSDGTPVTTNDVSYTYHMILRLGAQYPDYEGGGVPTEVKSFEVLGPYSFRITTTHPVNPRWFEFNGLNKLMPLPEHAWRHYSPHDMTEHLEDPSYFQVVDGPFRLERFHLSRSISFVPNPAYSGSDKPHIGRIVFKFLSSPESIFFALKANALQLANLPWGLYQARKQLKDDKTFVTGPPWGFNYLGFNFDAPSIAFIRDVRVRLAIMHAVDQDQIIQVRYFGHGTRDYGPIPTNPPGFLSDRARALIAQGAYDPALAGRLLDAAGWRMGPDHLRYKDGHPLKITLLVTPDRVNEPVMLKAMLAKVGIDLDLQVMPFNEVIAKIMNPKDTQWQAIFLAWSLSPYPSQKSLFGCNSAYNSYHYCNHHLDALADAVRANPGDAALKAFQDYFIAQQPVVVVPGYKVYVASASNVHGLDKAFSPMGGFNPQYLWIDRRAPAHSATD